MAEVFLGPTLSVREARVLLDARYNGPAGLGDIYEAVSRGSKVILLIDGSFESGPAVWHKEIHWAIDQGTTVVGAASMGALRAVELEPCGMIGLGQIYQDFKTGVLTDDDEVAVHHAPGDEDYRCHSEAMVNIRATLAAAADEAVIDQDVSVVLIAIAKELFYPDRSYGRILADARVRGLSGGDIARFHHWLPNNMRDVKRQDSIVALKWVAERQHNLDAPLLALPFERTVFWEVARAEFADPAEDVKADLIGKEA